MNWNHLVGVLSGIAGLIVMVGGWVDAAILRSGHPDHVSMKPMTAVAFMALAPAIYWLHAQRDPRRIARIVAAWTVIALMGIATFAPLMAERFNAIFVRDGTEIHTPFPGVPSAIVILQFIALAVCALDVIPRRVIVGHVVAGISLCVLAGHATHTWWMTGYVEHISTGEAIPTALVFLLIGLLGLRPVKA